MGNYHPHGDSSIYDALVRLAQPWSMRYPLIDGQGNFGSRGNDPAAAMRYTECRLSPLAMAMLQDIDEDTVNFSANYDGKTEEPDVLPARVPNLLINGSSGIAVGMATNIPPHNLREVGAGVVWALENPDATDEELLDRAHGAHQGPRLPDRRADRRPRRHRAGVPHRARLGADARGRRGGGGRQGSRDPRRHRTAVPGQPGQPRSSRSPRSCATASSRASPRSTTSPATASACASWSRSSATPWPRSC